MLELKSSFQEEIAERAPEYVKLLSREEFSWAHELLERLTAHSPWTADHSLRVGYMVYKIGLQADLSESELVALTLGGALHDVGKLNIDATFLNSFQPMDNRNIFKKHPRDGYEMLRAVSTPEAQEAAAIMLTHHKFQGDSYPDDAMLMPGTRLYDLQSMLAITDGVDAMLSDDRPYQKPFTPEEVLFKLSFRFPESQIEQAILVRSELLQ